MKSTSCRVVMIGESAVGKTSLLHRYIRKTRPENISSTVGAVFQCSETSYEGTPVTLQIWDTAGQEQYKSLGPVYYRRAMAAVAVFDVTRRSTMIKLEEWIKELRSQAKDPYIVVAANKADLFDNADVTQDETIEWAASFGLECVWASAMDGTGVEETFSSVVKGVLDKISASQVSDNVDLEASANTGSCC